MPDTINDILWNNDPLCLRHIEDIPRDEYDGEAARIHSAMTADMDIDRLTAIVTGIFDDSFGKDAYKDDSPRAIATAIINL
jgi:hypothetical protein